MDAPLIRVGHGLRAAASAAGPAASGLASRSISGALRPAICHPSRATAVAATIAARHFSALNRPSPKYPGHVPLTKMEQAGMAIGSGIMSLFNPYRAGTSCFFILFLIRWTCFLLFFPCCGAMPASWSLISTALPLLPANVPHQQRKANK